MNIEGKHIVAIGMIAASIGAMTLGFYGVAGFGLLLSAIVATD